MATISSTPRPGYAWDATDNCWYPIGTGPHTHSDYITQSTAINPSIVDAKGDLIVGSAADTVIRKPVGTDGQLLYADSTATGGIKWDAAPASGSMTLLSTTTLSGTSTTVSSISGAYKNLLVIINNVYTSTGNALRINPNATDGISFNQFVSGGTAGQSSSISSHTGTNLPTSSNPETTFCLNIFNYAQTTNGKNFTWSGGYYDQTSIRAGAGFIGTTSAITSLQFTTANGLPTFSGGTVLIYGVN